MPHFSPSIPQQPNFTDCGIYLLQYVEAFFKSPIMDFTLPITSLSDWFPTASVENKRDAIGEIIKKLAKQENPQKVFIFPDILNSQPSVAGQQGYNEILNLLGEYTLEYASGFVSQPKGIINRSNWCYAIATLQALMACSPLNNLLLHLANKSVPDINHFPVLNTMVVFARKWIHTEATSLDPSCVLEILLNMPGGIFTEGRQEDAEECINTVLNSLSQEVKNTQQQQENNYNHIQVRTMAPWHHGTRFLAPCRTFLAPCRTFLALCRKFLAPV